MAEEQTQGEKIMAIIGIEYEQFQPETYCGFTLHHNGMRQLFAGFGNTPNDDLKAVARYAKEQCISQQGVCDESVADFFDDGGTLEMVI